VSRYTSYLGNLVDLSRAAAILSRHHLPTWKASFFFVCVCFVCLRSSLAALYRGTRSSEYPGESRSMWAIEGGRQAGRTCFDYSFRYLCKCRHCELLQFLIRLQIRYQGMIVGRYLYCLTCTLSWARSR